MLYRRGFQIHAFTPRSVAISEEEKTAAKETLKEFDEFLRLLHVSRHHDEKLSSAIEGTELSQEDLFSIRQKKRDLDRSHRDFREKARQRYLELISVFKSALEKMTILEQDTETFKIKTALTDTMQSLVDVLESFLEVVGLGVKLYEDPSQIKKLIALNQKANQYVVGIESVIESQLKGHFERDILGRSRVADYKHNIRKRARLIRMMAV